MADFVREPTLLDGRGTVAAADDADCSGLRGLGHRTGDRLGARIEGGYCENTHRAVPHDRACALDPLGEELGAARPDVQTLKAVGNVTFDHLLITVGLEVV